MQTAVAISLNNERTGIICCSRYISAVRLPWCHGIGGNATDNLNDDQGDAGLCRHQTPDGVVVAYPWNLNRVERTYAPDVILLGWDAGPFSRLNGARGVTNCGIVQRLDDLHWPLAATRLRGGCRYRSHNCGGDDHAAVA